MNSNIFHQIIITLFVLLQTQTTYSQSGIAKSLEKGNKWFYFDSNIGNFYKKVLNDTLIGENKYAIITTHYKYIQKKEYERADSTKIYQYSVDDSTEIPIIDFSLQIGDSLNKFVVDKIDTNYFWGKQRKFIYIGTDFFYLYHERTCFVEGIGMFSSEYSGLAVSSGETKLNGAIIENIVYGDTLSTNIKNYQTKYKPNGFFLSQNYPNPFNFKTSIEYKIPFISEVEISVYNILGEKIKILTNGKKKQEFIK